MNRTFAIGDIHGDVRALGMLLAKLPAVDEQDTLVFVGDYVDRGPASREVIELLRELPACTPAKVVCLRGNHEDAWIRVVDEGWPEFILPPPNGCLAALRSFTGGRFPEDGERPSQEEFELMMTGTFLPDDVVEWMRELPYFYEDEHAIYVHAGLTKGPQGFLHPALVHPRALLVWVREEAFFREYQGKLVVFGHTATPCLPQELSSWTPEDPLDMWAGPCAIGLDTGCGKGGFLTAIELPARRVYETR